MDFRKPLRRENRNKFRIGIECEFFAFYKESLLPFGIGIFDTEKTDSINTQVSFSLKTPIDLISRILKNESYRPIVEDKTIVGVLFKKDLCLTFEPGGQLEISTTVKESALDLKSDLDFVLKELNEAAQGELVFLSCGINPIALDHPLILPKRRYQVMTDYFNSIPQSRGIHMMRYTASNQVNIDIPGTREDWYDSIRLASFLSPLSYFLFKNSFYFENKLSHSTQERWDIWKKTDTSRTGFSEELFLAPDPEQAYLDKALEAYVMYIPCAEHQPKWQDLSFKVWIEEGYEDKHPGQRDWERHLTTLFPDVRIRKFLEMRTSDALPFEFFLIPGLFWQTVLKSKENREEIWKLFLEINSSRLTEKMKLSSPLSFQEKQSLSPLMTDKSFISDPNFLLILIDKVIELADKKREKDLLLSFKSWVLKRDQNLPETGIAFIKTQVGKK